MTGIYMFLAAVCVLAPLVALHEWGHYIVARLCGVRVLTFSIGMGPRLAGWTSKTSGTDYRLSLLPFGGYVRMLDEREAEVAEADKPYAFNNQHPLKKIAIVLAGPVMNFVIAIALFFVLFMQPMEHLNTRIGGIDPDSPAANSGLSVGDKIVAVDAKVVNDWQGISYTLMNRMGETGAVAVSVVKSEDLLAGTAPSGASEVTYALPITRFMQVDTALAPSEALGVSPWQPNLAPVIGALNEDGAGKRMGLQVGDTITAINGVPITDWLSVTKMIRAHPEKMMQVDVLRAGMPVRLSIMPQGKKIDGQLVGQIGASVANHDKISVPDEYKDTTHNSAPEALSQAVVKTYDLSVMTLKSIGKMLSGLIGLENLSGPIRIADVSKQSFEMGWMQVLSTAALISLSLAVLNLLPIPVLDGGHILYHLYELIRGKPLSEGVQMVGLNLGMLLLLAVMLIAVGNDISRLFG